MMSKRDVEQEVKFYISSLKNIEHRLKKLDANIIQTRSYEYNLLFDNEGEDLTLSNQILRLRKGKVNKLTIKGSGEIVKEIHVRKEIEVEVNDFDQTIVLFDTLGFHIIFIYEKYRTVYSIQGTTVCLDEMPYGNFVEVEGTDTSKIKEISKELGLCWEKRILSTYINLFQVVSDNLNRKIENLTFSNFDGINITPRMLKVLPSDV